MHRRIRSILAAGGAATLLVGGTAATAAPSGAIFTTDVNGSFVNGNVYASKEDVYLNGGPRVNQNCSAAGLPEGDYYFQVTDPSGEMLLSSDALGERKIRVSVSVSGGVITAYLGTFHATGSPPPERCGGVTVGLTPFGVTPNPGGEYKVWLTPVLPALGCDESLLVCEGSFLPSNSKTDNFKVEAPNEPDGD